MKCCLLSLATVHLDCCKFYLKIMCLGESLEVLFSGLSEGSSSETVVVVLLPLRPPNTKRHLYKGPSPLKTVCFGLSLSDNSLLWWNPLAANTQHDINTVLAHCSHQRCFVVREGQTACFPFIPVFFLHHPTLTHPSFLLPSGLLWIVDLNVIIPGFKV